MRFPDAVTVALHESGVTVTCLPVDFGDGSWQAAIYYVLPPDSHCLAAGEAISGPFSVSVDADLHEHAHGTVIELAIEIAVPPDPLIGVMLFLTGHSSAQFDTLSLLANQSDIPLFIGDAYCHILWQQRIPLAVAHRQVLREILDEAVGRDALIRLSGHYDAERAFADVAAQRGAA